MCYDMPKFSFCYSFINGTEVAPQRDKQYYEIKRFDFDGNNEFIYAVITITVN